MHNYDDVTPELFPLTDPASRVVATSVLRAIAEALQATATAIERHATIENLKKEPTPSNAAYDL